MANHPRAGLAVLATLVSTGVTSGGVNLVFNGGFEQGFLGWTVPPNMPPGPNGALFFVSTSGNAHEGTNFARLSSTQLLYISQFQPDTVPGTDYELEFWLRLAPSGAAAPFTVRWEGQVVFQQFVIDSPSNDWARFTVPVTSNFVGSNLEFGQAFFPGEFHIDSISVRQVPAPSALPLMALGGLAAVRRGRR